MSDFDEHKMAFKYTKIKLMLENCKFHEKKKLYASLPS